MKRLYSPLRHWRIRLGWERAIGTADTPLMILETALLAFAPLAHTARLETGYRQCRYALNEPFHETAQHTWDKL